jgi:hypothetical protein
MMNLLRMGEVRMLVLRPNAVAGYETLYDQRHTRNIKLSISDGSYGLELEGRRWPSTDGTSNPTLRKRVGKVQSLLPLPYRSGIVNATLMLHEREGIPRYPKGDSPNSRRVSNDGTTRQNDGSRMSSSEST